MTEGVCIGKRRQVSGGKGLAPSLVWVRPVGNKEIMAAVVVACRGRGGKRESNTNPGWEILMHG